MNCLVFVLFVFHAVQEGLLAVELKCLHFSLVFKRFYLGPLAQEIMRAVSVLFILNKSCYLYVSEFLFFVLVCLVFDFISIMKTYFMENLSLANKYCSYLVFHSCNPLLAACSQRIS